MQARSVTCKRNEVGKGGGFRAARFRAARVSKRPLDRSLTVAARKLSEENFGKFQLPMEANRIRTAGARDRLLEPCFLSQLAEFRWRRQRFHGPLVLLNVGLLFRLQV